MKTNLSRKQLIEMMKNDVIPNIPDESFNDFNHRIEHLKLEYKKKDVQLVNELENIAKNLNNEQEIISIIKMLPHANILFNVYRKKQYSKLIWNLLK